MAIGAPERAIEAFTECLELNEQRQLCRRYRSISNLFLGNIDAALDDALINAEANYFNGFDAYIPVFLERDERMMAFAASRMTNWRSGFPHKEYIAALNDPDNQPDDRMSVFKDWAKSKNFNITAKTQVMFALHDYDEITVDTFDNDYAYLWLPQFSHFRQSPEFKRLANDLGLVTYWREHGFPQFCQETSEQDFECA